MTLFELDNLVYIPTAICVPVAIIGNIRLFKLRKEMFMKKRSRSTTFGLNVSLIIAMMAISAMRVSILHSNNLILSIFIIFLFIAWWLLLFFLNIRNWLIYFKYKWTYYQLQLEWQQLINPNIVEFKNINNWYIANASKYGNLSFVYKLFGFSHFIGCCLCIIGTLIRIHSLHNIHNAIIGTILMIISLVPTIIFYVVIVCKTPSFNDVFHIHWESKMQSKISVLLVIVFIICNIIFFSTASNLKIASIFAVILLTLVFFAMNFVSTFGLISKYKGNNNKMDKTIHLRINESSNRIDLEQILLNKKAMHLFMVHLSKEYSIECLLSYIEFTQYQQWMLNEIDNIEDDQLQIELNRCKTPTVENSSLHQRFPSNIPQSVIISKNPQTPTPEDKSENDINLNIENKINDNDAILISAKMKAHELYNKYIKIGSEMELNISGNHRKKLRDLLQDKEVLMQYDNIKLTHLITIFDETKQMMTKLLHHSLRRYKLEPEYKELVSLFPNISSQSLV